jgi:hypothetical protein
MINARHGGAFAARRLSSVMAVALASATLTGSAVAAASKPPVTPPQVSAVDVSGGHLASPVRLALTGNLTCTKGAHYHLNVWLVQQDRGALAKGSIPSKLSPKASKAAVAQAKATVLCSGASQPWTLALAAVGAHPAGFTPGPANTCLVATVGKSRLYTLQQSCTQITLG